MADGVNSDEPKRAKRDKAKENDFYEQKRAEQEEKRLMLAKIKEDAEKEEERQEAERVLALKRQAELRAKQKKGQHKIETLREGHHKAREDDWNQRNTAEIMKIVNAHAVKQDQAEQAKLEARAKRREVFQVAAGERLKAKEKLQDLETTRASVHERRDTQLELRGSAHADQVKAEAMEELQSFVDNPCPTPLKQVISGRLRPVPRVTELLANYKDQREGIEDLEGANIHLRCMMTNERLMEHVVANQKDFEARRLTPPRPLTSDLVRMGTGGRSPNKKLLASSMSQSGMSWMSTAAPSSPGCKSMASLSQSWG